MKEKHGKKVCVWGRGEQEGPKGGRQKEKRRKTTDNKYERKQKGHNYGKRERESE